MGPRQHAVWAAADERAAAEGVSVSSLAARALREYLDRHPEPDPALVAQAAEWQAVNAGIARIAATKSITPPTTESDE